MSYPYTFKALTSADAFSSSLSSEGSYQRPGHPPIGFSDDIFPAPLAQSYPPLFSVALFQQSRYLSFEILTYRLVAITVVSQLQGHK